MRGTKKRPCRWSWWVAPPGLEEKEVREEAKETYQFNKRYRSSHHKRGSAQAAVAALRRHFFFQASRQELPFMDDIQHSPSPPPISHPVATRLPIGSARMLPSAHGRSAPVALPLLW